MAKTLDDYHEERDQLFYGNNTMWNSPEGRDLAEYHKNNLEKDIIERSGYRYLDSVGLGHYENGLTIHHFMADFVFGCGNTKTYLPTNNNIAITRQE